MGTGENPGWDRLWTPWRYAYVTGDRGGRAGVPESLSAWPGDKHCVFCNMIAAVDYAVANGTSVEAAEGAVWVLERGVHGFLVLNAFPYNSGHLMAVPYAHADSLAALPLEVAEELLRMTRRAERALRSVYKPHGLNVGLNLGAPAGAGIAEHMHIHAVPRWTGDNNFMAVLAGTRVLPEVLDESWNRIRAELIANSFERSATIQVIVDPIVG
jgi:ATP adenylyltransferase